VNPRIEEPAIPPRLHRPLAALWISLGLHAALVALVQVAPPAAPGAGGPVIEARLMPPHAAASSAGPVAETGPAQTLQAAAARTESETLDVPRVAPPPVPPPVVAPPAPPVAAPPPLAPPPPPAALSSAVDLTWYSAREVDVHPRALYDVLPDYPPEAERQKLSGRLRLSLKLEADGRVGDVQVTDAEPPGVFDETTLAAFRAAHFAPAQKNGRPVRALMVIEVVYDWDARR
jgi:protein TonB